MRGIKTKLILSVGLLLIIVCGAISYSSYINASKILESSTESSLIEISKQSSAIISNMIKGNLKELDSVAARTELVDPAYTTEMKVDVLRKEVERIGNERMAYIDIYGNSTSTNGKTQNLGDRGYFTKAMQGESNVSDPSIGKSTGDLLVFYGAPIKQDGKVIGVLQEIQKGTNLSELAAEVTYGKSGYAYLINNAGTIIAHKDSELVMNETNIPEKAKGDATFQSWAAAVSTALEKKKGFTTYNYGGVDYYAGFAQVEGTEWEIMVVIDKAEIMSGLNTLKDFTIKVSAISLLAGIVLVFLIAGAISRGIKASSKVMVQMAKGDLTTMVPKRYLKKHDEVGAMSRAMAEMSGSLSGAICKIKDNSQDIDQQSEQLSQTSKEISQASENVAESILNIAGGTSTQNEKLARITGILHDFGEMMSRVVSQIHDVDSASGAVSEKAVTSREDMNRLSASVERVGGLFSDFSEKIDHLGGSIHEIDQFTKVINEIAFQTNILALNASIEAARAGAAGKGFAVVAEEIGTLAARSQESSEKISELVEGISTNTNKIVEQTSVMNEELTQQGEVIRGTIDSFEAIIGSIDEVLPKIGTAEKTVREVDSLKDTIVNDVDEIAHISEGNANSAQTISAAAEELSATIREMSGIANALKKSTGEMREGVDHFKVR